MRLTPFLSVAFALAAVGTAGAQPQPTPTPTLTKVTITQPAPPAGTSWRTAHQVIPLEFSSDAANGRFVVNSTGGDLSFSSFLPQGGSGQVAVGFTREGPHAVAVTVAGLAGPGPGVAPQSTSPTVTVVYDLTPPIISITRIKVNELEGFVAYSPTTVYYTNADQVVLQGTVRDQYTPADQVTISSRGAPAEATAQPDTNGRWELTVDLSSVPDGEVDLAVVATERMSDGALSAAGPPTPVRIGR